MLIIGEQSTNFLYKGTVKVVDNSHPQYNSILSALRVENYDKAFELMDMSAKIRSVIPKGAEVTFNDGIVVYNGQELKGYAIDKIIEFAENGIDFQPLLKFMTNLMANPSTRAVNELYGFLENSNLPITSDGHFLAYKKIRENYRDIYTNRVDNSVGEIVEMSRDLVNPNSDQTCSTGLHFCSYSYLPYFGSGYGNRVVLVKINPADVVSIPSDYNNAKGRTCRYEVIEEITQDWAEKEGFNVPLADNSKYAYKEYQGSYVAPRGEIVSLKTIYAYDDVDAYYTAVDMIIEKLLEEYDTRKEEWMTDPTLLERSVLEGVVKNESQLKVINSEGKEITVDEEIDESDDDDFEMVEYEVYYLINNQKIWCDLIEAKNIYHAYNKAVISVATEWYDDLSDEYDTFNGKFGDIKNHKDKNLDDLKVLVRNHVTIVLENEDDEAYDLSEIQKTVPYIIPRKLPERDAKGRFLPMKK